MATKRTFAVEATAAARNLDLLRTQISRLQLGLALPQYQRVEFLTLAMLLASALELRAPAVGSGFRIALRFFLKASAFFPVSASLFSLRSLSPLFFAPARLVSFAIFSWRVLILASESELFSISAKWQLPQAFRLVLASELLPLARQILSSTSPYEDAAILWGLAKSQFRPPTFLLPVWLLQLGWVILLLSQRPRFCSSIFPLPASLSESDWAISPAKGN